MQGKAETRRDYRARHRTDLPLLRLLLFCGLTLVALKFRLYALELLLTELDQ